MGTADKDIETQHSKFHGVAVWLYWLAWTFVVAVDAASYQPSEYHFWLLSPYAWWIAPFVLWWTIPRNTQERVPLVWPLFILAWAAWRVLSLEYEIIRPWHVFADDSSFLLLQLPLHAAVAGTALALAFSRAVVRIAGDLATRAALVLGLCAATLSFQDRLLDLDRWQVQPVANAVRVFDALLIALLLAVTTHSVQSVVRNRVAHVQAAEVKRIAAPRVAGFGSLFLLSVLSTFGAFVAIDLAAKPWSVFGIVIAGVALPMTLATWSGVRAWRRLEFANQGSSTSERLRTVAGRAAVFAGVGSLWVLFIWISAPRAGNDLVDALRTLPGPVWSVRAIPDSAVVALEGELAFGVTAAVRSTLRSHPSARFIQIDSPGGLIEEAELISLAVRERGLITVARDQCASACTAILAAGRERWLLKATDVGLHSPSRLGLPTAATSDGISKYFQSQGISDSLADHGGAVPSWDIWYPTEKELLVSGLITRVVTDEEYKGTVLKSAATRGR